MHAEQEHIIGNTSIADTGSFLKPCTQLWYTQELVCGNQIATGWTLLQHAPGHHDQNISRMHATVPRNLIVLQSFCAV